MSSPLGTLDWAIVVSYVIFALWVGARFAKRAGQNTEEYFLSGRSLPWWVAGTSMVATSFAADTPLAISGWVRDSGIWKNWAWWCFAINGALQVFLFARWWRRGEVMTKAELVELRYGGSGARVLRGAIGILQAGVINTLVMCWVLLAASKIFGVLFGVDKTTGLVVGSAIALTYSLMAGFWGVVVTDMVQFVMAMVGAIALAFVSWDAFGGAPAAWEAVESGRLSAETLSFLPPPGEGGFFSASFWTASFTAACVYLGVSWWAVENVDGSGTAVQRICASKDERQGLLATLWFNVAHYALRPWCWILVGIASIFVLPTIELSAPVDGTLAAESYEEGWMDIRQDSGEIVRLDLLAAPGAEDDWKPLPTAKVGAPVLAGEVVARTDTERAYVVMMIRYLPVGLLGLMAASLLAAFMSTIDTHVNLAASFFVNDVYRRFIDTQREPGHYVTVARFASVGALLIAGFMASFNDSIGDLFLFFFALLGGVGPIYVMRWLWWRVRASTELTAMVASTLSATALTHMDGITDLLGTAPIHWSVGPLSTADGALLSEGRLILVVLVSLSAALVSMLVTRAPDPATLVDFYRKVRPIGFWGPVKALAPDVVPPRETGAAILGSLSGIALIYGLTLGLGYWLLGQTVPSLMAGAAAAAGALGTYVALRRLPRTSPE